MKHPFACTAIFLLPLSLAAVAAQAQNPPPAMPMGQSPMPMGEMGGMHKPAPPAGPLQITFGDKSATWTAATLAPLPHTMITVFNSHTKTTQTYSGVPLICLLTSLGVPSTPHGSDLNLYLVAVGSDGYEAVYSVAEVNPDVHEGAVIVADTEDDKPLAEDGPLKLVAIGETRPARWVRNLVAIRVESAK